MHKLVNSTSHHRKRRSPPTATRAVPTMEKPAVAGISEEMHQPITTLSLLEELLSSDLFMSDFAMGDDGLDDNWEVSSIYNPSVKGVHVNRTLHLDDPHLVRNMPDFIHAEEDLVESDLSDCGDNDGDEHEIDDDDDGHRRLPFRPRLMRGHSRPGLQENDSSPLRRVATNGSCGGSSSRRRLVPSDQLSQQPTLQLHRPGLQEDDEDSHAVGLTTTTVSSSSYPDDPRHSFRRSGRCGSSSLSSSSVNPISSTSSTILTTVDHGLGWPTAVRKPPPMTQSSFHHHRYQVFYQNRRFRGVAHPPTVYHPPRTAPLPRFHAP